MAQFQLIIKSISDHHHRDVNVIQMINKIQQHYKSQIKQTSSNEEIFHIYESNKLIVLFLLKTTLSIFSDSVFNKIFNKIGSNGNRYCHFSDPELERFKGEEEMKLLNEELLAQNQTSFKKVRMNHLFVHLFERIQLKNSSCI